MDDQFRHGLARNPSFQPDGERGIRRLGYLLTEVMLLLVLGIFIFNVLTQKPIVQSLLFSLAWPLA